MPRLNQAPRACPVCGERLALTRLSCDECGTELAGHFPTCEYCSLPPDDRETLRVFLSSRGNMKEVERHLNVSYPTARVRFDQILVKLGFDSHGYEAASEASKQERDKNEDVLRALSEGSLDVDEALQRLKES
ncbi:MAG: DUF2089 domain-containing protein [Actinomycetota bacterium]|nr:DUF2089 domain-containing protein [Actinomycetota bacterium]